MLKRLARSAMKHLGYKIVRRDHFVAADRRVTNAEREARSYIAAAYRAKATEACRPAFAITEDDAWAHAPADIADLDYFVASRPEFSDIILPYFSDYPKHSLMSGHSRSYLYSFVRALRPAAVLEIGSHFGGTAEVLARAVAENGQGVVFTIDPFGDTRVPSVIARWPQRLRCIVKFDAVNSMAFLSQAADQGRQFDLVLIDGHHDLEFASFDIEMAARLLSRRGLMIIDNCSQIGPYYAARRFHTRNPHWSWHRAPVPSADMPFRHEDRASLPETDFIVLQAPGDIIVSDEPRSWGQQFTTSSVVDGFELHLSASVYGNLHYEAILRAFGNGNRRVEEFKHVGQVEIRAAAGSLCHRFDAPPLRSDFPALYEDARHTIELALAWRSGDGCPLRLHLPPQAFPRP